MYEVPLAFGGGVLVALIVFNVFADFMRKRRVESSPTYKSLQSLVGNRDLQAYRKVDTEAHFRYEVSDLERIRKKHPGEYKSELRSTRIHIMHVMDAEKKKATSEARQK